MTTWRPDNDGVGIVTIVIAAYERPQALNNALQSLYRQTWRDWRALVVCDACTQEFMGQVDRSDERVRYLNLPLRCGHQYGPNSIGIHLADTEFLAFLNHDDLWLEDHLALAMDALSREDTDAYLGRAAFCHLDNQPGWPDGPERLMFSELNRPEHLWRCMSGPFYFFEPASAWVVRTSLARKSGHWSPPDKIQVTPVMDWLMRLTVAGARFHCGQRVSVLKLNLHINSNIAQGIPEYYQGDAGQHHVERMLSKSANQLRNEIAEDLSLAETRGLKVRKEMSGPLQMTPVERDRLNGFLLYLQTGILLPNLIGPPIGPYKPGIALTTLTKRTGEYMDRFPATEAIIASLSPP